MVINIIYLERAMLKRILMATLVALIMDGPGVAWAQREGQVTGERMRWHPVTITFDGPAASETGDPNPFRDYRLNVTFRHEEGRDAFVVPGYFAADGDAAETSATSGSRWRVHFTPLAGGPMELHGLVPPGRRCGNQPEPDGRRGDGFRRGSGCLYRGGDGQERS